MLAKIILITVVGTIGGVFTTLAGGGSLIVIPVLMFLGLPPAVANGTNRVGILIASTAALYNFKKHGYLNLKLSLILGLPAVFGSIIGAKLALCVSRQLFEYILITVMIFMLGLITYNSIIDIKSKNIYLSGKRVLLLALIFFAIGIYGGLIQAGVGLIILITLSLLTGFTVNEINSIKVSVIFLYIIFSLFIFVSKNEINWMFGMALSLGSFIGAYLGTVFSFMADTILVKIIYILCIISLIFTII